MVRTKEKLDLDHKDATYKQHIHYTNATVKSREDKRKKDRLYESVHEWTR